jgi:hypothetical protein
VEIAPPVVDLAPPIVDLSSEVDEVTHPLLVINPVVQKAPEHENEPDYFEVHHGDFERDLEKFEQSGKGISRPEVWDQAEALGVVSRQETGLEAGASGLSKESETGDLEALAAEASLTDLSRLIPHARAGSGPAVGTDSAAPAPQSLSDADVERVARRVVELISQAVVRDVAWEVVPELAHRLVRERLAEIEAS